MYPALKYCDAVMRKGALIAAAIEIRISAVSPNLTVSNVNGSELGNRYLALTNPELQRNTKIPGAKRKTNEPMISKLWCPVS